MHDAIELDLRGIPAAAICTDSFLPTGRAMASARGLPEYPIAVVRHPVVNRSDDELRQEAEKALPQVVEILTGRPA